MKTALRALLVGVVMAGLVGLPALPEGVLRPMQIDHRSVSLAFADEGGGAWVSGEIEGGSTIAGLTWDDAEDAPANAEVRIRIDGEWSDWQRVEVDDEHAPDPASEEAATSRGGTSPIVVEGAEAIQFRIDGPTGPPADLVAELVDVDDPDASQRVKERPGAADAAPAVPKIHPRSDWGGQNCPSSRTEPIEYSNKVEVVFVHHTAGHTSYSQAEVPSIIRGICDYHVNGRGWSDIGYNALVDRYGGIWVGRDGGIDKGVIGAHTGGFNSWSTGVVLIGDHHNGGAPTGAAQDALARYAAWKMDVHNINPLGTATITSGGNSKHAKDKAVPFDTLSGHSDASYTACPGKSCYPLLDSFRQKIDAMGGFRTFGGRAASDTMELREDGTWQRPTFTFSFSHPADWVFVLRDLNGRELLRRTGSGTADQVTWDPTIGGKPAGKGEYTTHITATRRSDGISATQADNTFALGGPLGEFDDVAWDNVFEDDIAWLAVAGITRGCNPPHNTRFCPSDQVTRGQMAAFLTRALELPPGETGTFEDVSTSSTFAKDIAALAKAGVTKGCNPPANDRFCPNDPVSRKQMAAFLVRGVNLTDDDHPGFVDVPPSSPFVSDIRRLATAKVTLGCNPPDNTKYCPDESVTRQQMAAFLHRALPK